MVKFDNVKFEIERRRCVIIFLIDGDLIITNSQNIQNVIDKEIEKGKEKVIFDFQKIGYIDSFGIGIIVKTKSALDKRKRMMAVIVNKSTRRLFEKCHLDEHINLFDNEEKAFNYLK